MMTSVWMMLFIFQVDFLCPIEAALLLKFRFGSTLEIFSRMERIEIGFPTGPQGIGCALVRDIIANFELNLIGATIGESG